MKIVIGGQLRKDDIKNLLDEIDPKIEVEIKSDFDAALAMQTGNYDLYLGACDTGGGGALAMAISILGVDKCKTIATQSNKKTEAEIKQMIEEGNIAFGFVESSFDYATKAVISKWKEVNGE